MPGTRYLLEVNPTIPPRLARLEELANNLWYSWDRPTRALFSRLHPALWRAVNHSPKAFLKRIDQKRLKEAAEDPIFLGTMNKVLSDFDTYEQMHTQITLPGKAPLVHTDQIAYFCAEFGFHESLPIYSGGLGILAGDHCKAASDLRLPFVAVGLLYRQGYFSQTIDRDGRQDAHYSDNDFDDMPIAPVLRGDGSELRVSILLLERQVQIKVWKAQVGHATLYLLDTDLPENAEHDRHIAHRLYGGDRTTRIEQEILLGMGGVRAVEEIGVKPSVWHINEGHAAFLILERVRGLVKTGMSFHAALEVVACNTVFTTHTPVPAGHDHFGEDMVTRYFQACCSEMGCDVADLVALGRINNQHEFNMTALAIRGSRFHNAVSRIHADVSARICSELWPQVDPEENPMDYVTNGVHVSTFLATDWYETFDRHLGLGWMHRLTDHGCWQGVHRIPDQVFWSIRQSLKAQMLHLVRARVREQHTRNHGSEAHLDRLLRFADPANPTVLTIGFARRFATYKRSTLLFQNLDWLREIIRNSERPVLFIFAGKAHPADEPGQAMIREIQSISSRPEFEGRILLLEGYDLHLARRLISGVDVWLNNPIYPLEASGTSGMKAAINGAINLSVLDGWWGEAYDGSNGWAIKPVADAMQQQQRDAEEARTLYELLQDQIVPLYYRNTSLGYSPEWVATAKRSISTIMPRFNMERTVREYVEKFYAPASQQWRRVSADNFGGARQLAEWKQGLRAAWAGVKLRRIDTPVERMQYGEKVRFEIAVSLNGLSPDDLTVELMFNRPGERNPVRAKRFALEQVKPLGPDEHLYVRELTPDQCGKLEYRVRAYPKHPLLTHPLEMGMMAWL
jgi:starch phosphorylase